MESSYREIFIKQYKKCHSKKQYKRLCKQMIKQFDVIDAIDNNLWRIFSDTMGEDVYPKAVAMAIQMYILEKQGMSCDILSYEWTDQEH